MAGNDRFDPEFMQLVDVERELAVLSVHVAEMADASGLTRREIARRMGIGSPATLQRVIRKGIGWNARVETLMRLAAACGYKAEVRFVPIKAS
jgi:DNA-binding transcriptional regulator LsrR (DeoR family)